MSLVLRCVPRVVLASLALVTLASGPPAAAAPVPAPPGSPAAQEILDENAVARLSWSVPERFGAVWASWRQSSSTYDPEVVNPQGWSVTLDGCASTAVRRIKTYVFTVVDPTSSWQRTVRSTTCRTTLRDVLPRQGAYLAELTVKTDFGSAVGTSRPVSDDIRIRDYLVVSLGDSIASGEGSPDAGGSYDVVFNNVTGKATLRGVRRAAVWQDRRCHRSALSAPARAARSWEAEDPHTSVTFVSFACSGADLRHLVSKRYRGIVPRGTSTVPPQVSALRSLLRTGAGRPARRVDALSVVIGANDIDFSAVLERCATTINIGDAERCVTADGLAGKVRRLDGRFAQLAAALRPVGAREVYLNRYPANPLRGAGCEIFGLTRFGVSGAESRAIYAWGRRLNAKIAKAAHRYRSDRDRWNLLPDPTAAFAPHAYCDAPSWFVRYRTSWKNQGDKYGTIHPNAAGQRFYRDLILSRVRLEPHNTPYRRVSVRVTAVKAAAAPDPSRSTRLGVSLFLDQTGLADTRVYSMPRSGRWVPVAASRGTFTLVTYLPRTAPRRPILVDLRAGGTQLAKAGFADGYAAGSYERSVAGGRFTVRYTITVLTP